MNIEDLGVSDKCLNELKQVGFTLVEEVVEFLETKGRKHMILEQWIPICFDELERQFRLQGFWSEALEQAWPPL